MSLSSLNRDNSPGFFFYPLEPSLPSRIQGKHHLCGEKHIPSRLHDTSPPFKQKRIPSHLQQSLNLQPRPLLKSSLSSAHPHAHTHTHTKEEKIQLSESTATSHATPLIGQNPLSLTECRTPPVQPPPESQNSTTNPRNPPTPTIWRRPPLQASLMPSIPKLDLHHAGNRHWSSLRSRPSLPLCCPRFVYPLLKSCFAGSR